MSCAHTSAAHEVSVFEAGRQIGGHTATVDVKLGTRRYAIDTGFICVQRLDLPNFIALMDSLGVSSKPTSMGFSVRDEQTGLEYSGTNLNSLFAQRGNLLSRRLSAWSGTSCASTGNQSRTSRPAGSATDRPWVNTWSATAMARPSSAST